MASNILKVAYANFTVLMGSGGARGMAFLTSILLARSLGAEGFGEFSLFQSALFITSQVPQAFDTAFIRHAKSNDDKAHVLQCLASATRLKIYFAMLILALAWPLAAVLNHFTPDKPHMGALVACGVISGTFLCFMNSIANHMRVNEQFGRYSIMQALYNLVVLLIIAAMVFIFKVLSVKTTIIVYLVVAFLFGFISLYLVAKISGNPWKAPSKLNQMMFSLSKWILLTVICFYTFSRIDILMLSKYLSFEETGIYSAAGQLILIISLMIGAGSTVFMPRSVAAISSASALRAYIKETLIPIAMITFGIAVLYVAAPYIFKIVFSSRYDGATPILRILLLGYFFVALYSPLSFLFYAINRPDLRFYLEFLKLASAIVALYLAIPRFGAEGAAYVMSACMAVNSIVSAIVLAVLLKKNMAAVPA